MFDILGGIFMIGFASGTLFTYWVLHRSTQQDFNRHVNEALHLNDD